MEHTIVKIYFKSEKTTDLLNSTYEFKMEHYCLNKFEYKYKLDNNEEQQTMEKSLSKVKSMEVLPNLFSFVKNDKYYTCYYRKTIIKSYGFG